MAGRGPGQVLRRIHERAGLRAFVWAALLAGLAGVLCFVPLFDVLGYDYAFAIGLGAALAGIDIGHGVVQSARRAGADVSLRTELPAAVVGALAVLVLPLVLSLANALRVRNCSIGAGLVFFLLLPVGSALYAAPAGCLVGVLFPRGRLGRVVVFLVPIVSVLWTLLRLYRHPPVFAFDPFGGYFPGPIYDEAMRPPERLLLFRLVNLVWIAGAVALVGTLRLWSAWQLRRRRLEGGRAPLPRPPRLVLAVLVTVGLLGAGIALYGARARLGFDVDAARLTAVLRRETRSTHFIVHSDPSADGTPRDRALVTDDLEFRYQQLVRILGAEPAGPVTVYLFPSGEMKKEMVGAGGTLYAKPWTREIFVQAERFPARRLRHELAHVFAGAFGDPVFGVSLAWRFPFPRLASGLIEGVAEAADFGDPDGRSTVHQDARAMIAAGLAPPLSAVVGAGFSTLAGARAYTIAGSFCHFLLATRGADRLRAVYRSAGDFQAAYGEPLSALEPAWRAFLKTQPLDQREQARAKERFRRPAIFQKICARELAARVQDARDRLYSAPEEAVALLTSVCRDDPHEPSYQLDLADAFAAAGLDDQALRAADTVEKDPDTTQPLQARAATLTANVQEHAGRFDEARQATQRALGLATEDGEQRAALARLRALADPASRETLGRVLFGDSATRGLDAGLVMYLIERFARAFPQEALGPYLIGRQLSFRDPRLALGPLEEACPLAGTLPRQSPLDPVFLTECHRLVGEAAFQAGDLERSRLAAEKMRDGASTQAERLRAEDFLERLAWQRARPRP